MSDGQAKTKPAVPKASRPHMPGYGLSDANSGSGLFPWDWAVQRLSKAQNYFVSTSRPDGTPHCMPVWGVWTDNAFYFSTGRRSRKAQNLRSNPRCVVAPENALESVVLEGIAEEITGPAALARMFTAYNDKYKYDLSGMDPLENIFYKVRPKVVFGLTLNLGATATRWTFE